MTDAGLMLTMGGFILAAATFWLGRQSAAKALGVEWGRLKSDIAHIKDDVAEVKDSLQQYVDRQATETQYLRRRIDEHLAGSYTTVARI